MAAEEPEGGCWARPQGSLTPCTPDDPEKVAAVAEPHAGPSAMEDATSTRGASSTSHSATSWTSSAKWAPIQEPDPAQGARGLCSEPEPVWEVEEQAEMAGGTADLQAPVTPLALATVLPPPSAQPVHHRGEDVTVCAPATPIPAVPSLHCSEIIQAVIGKQHEMERFMLVPVEDIPHSTTTKMAMLKNELDLLSTSIARVLHRAPPCSLGGGGAAAPPVGGWAVPAHGGQAPTQVWPPPVGGAPMQAYPAEAPFPLDVAYYPLEASYCAEADLPPEYRQVHPESSGVVDHHSHPMHYEVAPPEDHGGPAIFQGFQPPPSYAWCHAAPPEEEPAPKQPAPAEQQPAEPPATPAPLAPRPRSINTTSPPRETPPKPTAKLVLAAAMEQLRSCQTCCAQLRAEKRGVPTHEVESWCASMAEQLKACVERLEEKLEVHRRRSHAKDETIKRLYRRLQEAERASSELLNGAAVQMPGDLQEQARRGRPEPMQLEGLTGGQQQVPQHSLYSGLSAGDLQQGARSLGDLSDAGVEPVPVQASPSSSHTRASSSVQPPVEDPSRSLASARAGGAAPRRGSADPPSQKCLQRPANVPAQQQAQLRREAREVAHLRRRDVDYAGQLRARDQQIEQLTSTMRELQLVTQRQIGLYKRQLHLKENELQAKQDELNQHVSIAASSAGSGADGRGGRRHGAQVPSASMPGFASPQGPSLAAERRLHRGGVTPRPADCERGRNKEGGGSAAWTAHGQSKKEARERSLGALPRSPRGKARGSAEAGGLLGQGGEAGGLLSQADAAQAALRRRTSPTISGACRSTSADERAAARRRQEVEAAAAAPVGKGPTPRFRDGPMTARARR